MGIENTGDGQKNCAQPAPFPGQARPHAHIHWHVISSHFPISFFVAAFGFQLLHLFMAPACLELATNVMLAAGTLVMIPTMLSGWLSWKSFYHGAWTSTFRKKITIASLMLVFSAALSVWRFFHVGFFSQTAAASLHWFYMAGNMLIILGAAAEGYLGGR